MLVYSSFKIKIVLAVEIILWILEFYLASMYITRIALHMYIYIYTGELFYYEEIGMSVAS